MRSLVDANLSPRLAADIRQLRHDVVHVADIDMLTASDTEILHRAEIEQRVVVTADTDFPMILALRQASNPSVVLLRGVSELPPDHHVRFDFDQSGIGGYRLGSRRHRHDHSEPCTGPGPPYRLISHGRSRTLGPGHPYLTSMRSARSSRSSVNSDP